MPRKKKQPKAFATEAELCAAFIEALPKGWTVYAETGGHDMLLVRAVDGRQIGVQAKLKLNVEVVNQAIEDGNWYRVADAHPDYRAVLVPADSAGAFEKICGHLGVTIIRMRPAGLESYFRASPSFSPELPTDPKNGYVCREWHETATVKRHKLPEYVPDVRAGSPSPLQLTEWKIKAIKIAVTMELRGHLTRRDFQHHQIDHRRWITMGWIKAEEGHYVKDAFPNFKKQHPVNYKQIKADAPRWLPKTVFEAEPQRPML